MLHPLVDDRPVRYSLVPRRLVQCVAQLEDPRLLGILALVIPPHDLAGVAEGASRYSFPCCFAWPKYDNERGGLNESATRSVEKPADVLDLQGWC